MEDAEGVRGEEQEEPDPEMENREEVETILEEMREEMEDKIVTEGEERKGQ